MKPSGPIRPEEIQKRIPHSVIEAFSEIIQEVFDGSQAVVRQVDVLRRITAKGINRNVVMRERWLDVEEAFASAGWSVEFARVPGEEPTFTFTPQ